MSRRVTEEFINLTHTVRFSWFWRHTSSGYAQVLPATQRASFYDPVVLVCMYPVNASMAVSGLAVY
jgi:hypothetical protein